MQFAFTAAQSNCTWTDLTELWDVADDLDVYTTGWVYDHFYPLRTGPEEPTLEGWSCLAMLLGRTRRIRGGVLVSGIPYRHPAVLAKIAATVDIASGGRLELGVGAGWFEPECEAYGIELGSITERFDRLEEALVVIRSLLTKPTTSFTGRYFRLRDAWCEPKATQRPHPPIVLGGKGERRLLPLVAALRQPLELLGRRRRRVHPPARSPGRALRRRGPRPRRAHALGQRPPQRGRAGSSRRRGCGLWRGRGSARLRPPAPAVRSAAPRPARPSARPVARELQRTTRQAEVARASAHHGALPPSTLSSAPVIPAPASEASNRAIAATSSTLFRRLIIDSSA